MRINLLGQRGPIGGGRHFGEFCDALKSIRLIGDAVFEYDYFSISDYNNCLGAAGEDDINIHFFDVNSLPPLSNKFQWPVLPGTNVHWAIFESTILHPKQLDWLKSADIIFVPSAWGKDILIANGVAEKQIEVVPEGVDPEKFHPFVRKGYQTSSDEIFRVLVLAKYEARKGFPEILEGYAKAFGNDDSVRLILKSDSLWMKTVSEEKYQQNLSELDDAIKKSNIENAISITGDLADDELFHLYNASDVLLFPSRAEGWGLPLIEAIASGLPVATTVYSGHTEFLKEITSKIGVLSHEMTKVTDSCDAGMWAKSDPDQIAAQLQTMRTEKEKYQQLAHEASKHIRLNYSWQRAAEICIQKIQARMPLFELSIDM